MPYLLVGRRWPERVGNFLNVRRQIMDTNVLSAERGSVALLKLTAAGLTDGDASEIAASAELAERIVNLVKGNWRNPAMCEVCFRLAADLRPVVDEDAIVARILATVGREYKVTIGQIRGKSRKVRFAWPRQVVAYLIRCVLPDRPFSVIAADVGSKCHATPMHSVRAVNGSLEHDKSPRGDRSRARILRMKTDLQKLVGDRFQPKPPQTATPPS